MSKVILVTGATGKQGGALIRRITSSPQSQDFIILAVTRNTASSSASKLTSLSPTIKLIQGDMNDAPALFSAASAAAGPSGIYGVFSVQVPMGSGQSVETEEAQGKALVDEALKHGVKFFVYSGVERGGKDQPTDVPHFVSKHRIEQHLFEKTQGGGMEWCVLRPVAFMDNWTPDFMGKGFGAMWLASLGRQQKLQLIAVEDIGYFGAQAFLQPEKYRGRKIALAGDEVSFEEADAVFKKVTGAAMPVTFTLLGSVMMFMIGDLGKMWQWFKKEGYGVDIQELRREYPGLMDLETWLREKSGFAKKQ